MQVQAKNRNLRFAPRKVRRVVDLVRGCSLARARLELKFMNQGASEPVLKLINSAAANAQNNFGLSEKSLVIKKIAVDGGPITYRYRPRAMGRTVPVRKRTSHVTVVLEGEKKTIK